MYSKLIGKLSVLPRRLYFTTKLSLILKSCKNVFDNRSDDVVVMESIRNDTFYNVFSFLVCYFLSQRVNRVYILKDDGLLKHHDIYKSNSKLKTLVKNKHFYFLFNKARIFLSNIISFPLLLIKPNNLLFIKYSELYDETDDIRHCLNDGFNPRSPLSKHVDASHKRFFGGRDFDLLNEKHVNYARLSYHNEVINRNIANRLIDNVNPDLYISLDGIYTTFGPIVEVMKNNDISVLLYQVNGFKDRSIFIGEEHYSICNCTDYWYDFKEARFSSEVENVAKVFLDNRFPSLNYELKDGERDLFNELYRYSEQYEKTIVLFPNLTWDGAIRERDIIFDGLLDWMIKTVEWVKDKPYFLIIREHPMPLTKYNSTESSLSLLAEAYPEIKNINNIRLVSGTESLKSYHIVKNIVDCSVVYNGTLGIEISYMGYPVVFAGNSPYSDKKVGYEPKSKQEYFEILGNISNESNDFKEKKDIFVENAIVAAAYQFEYNTFYCPIAPNVHDFYNSNDKYWQSWDLSLDKFDLNKSYEWSRTINRFLLPLYKE